MGKAKTEISERIELKKNRIATLRKEIERLELAEARKIQRIAKKSGLMDLTLSDDDLLEAFRQVVRQKKSGGIKKPPVGN